LAGHDCVQAILRIRAFDHRASNGIGAPHIPSTPGTVNLVANARRDADEASNWWSTPSAAAKIQRDSPARPRPQRSTPADGSRCL